MANEENLRPFTKGDPRINRAGRPKGIKNWGTIVQQLLGDENLVDKVIAEKPSYWDSLPNKNGANAVVVAMMIESLSGNTKAADWLRKTGYGDKLKIDSEDGLFQKTKIEVEIVKPKVTDERDAESQLQNS